MKTIKKLKNNMKTVAGSALLVGATLAGATAVTAQDNGSSGDLGDYPAPFVTEDGEVDTTVVVGETADDGEPVSTADVVSAVEIAGSLGNAAFEESETSVSVSSTAAASWSAENGITLNRRNTNLFLYDGTEDGQTRLDDTDLNVLEDTSFQSEDNEEVEVEHDVQVGAQDQQFSPEGDYDDPVLHVDNPTNPSDTDNLLQASVEFDETMDFGAAGRDDFDLSATNAGDEAIEDGDEIELFGQDFTFSEDSDATELVFYGSSDRFEIATGESQTVTVDGEDHEFQVEYVSEASSNTQEATVIVDGETQSVEESDEINVGDQTVRVSDIYRTGPDGQGRVAFSQGSDELVINHGTTGSLGEVEVDGDTVDGVGVAVDSGTGDFQQTDGMTFYFGAADSDEDFVEAGEMYETPLFGLEFHYGGLNPDVSDADNAAEVITVQADEDDTAEVTFTASGEDDDTTLTVFTNDPDTNQEEFGDEDGTIAQYEGQTVDEDDKVVLNAFEEADMYEITEVDDTDLEDADGSSDDETLSLTLENVVTGDSVEVEETGIDLSAGGGLNEYTISDESIEGKDFDVTFEEGDEVNFVRSTAGTDRQLWPWMYTGTDSAMAFDQPSNDIDLTAVFDDVSASEIDSEEVDLSNPVDSTSGSGNDDQVAVSTSGTGNAPTAGTLNFYNDDGDLAGTASFSGSHLSSSTVTLDDDSGDSTVESVEVVNTDGGVGDITVEVVGDTGSSPSSGESATVSPVAERTADIPSGVVSNDATATVEFDGTNNVKDVTVNEGFVQYGGQLDVNAGSDGDIDLDRTNSGSAAGILMTQPENDEDQEEAYVVEASSDDNSQLSDVDAYTGRQLEDELDDEDVDVAYDEFGAYRMDDEEDDETDTLTFHYPGAQSTSGMAVTGTDGALSAEGGGGSGSTTTMSPTYEFADAALDTDSNVGQAKQNQNLILVGGPSVNSLVQELVDDGQTMAASEYTEGEGMIQMVDGWSSGNSALVVAGHSGEDTRAAGEFLANYRDHASDLEGQDQVTISTETGSVVQ
jgi:hypothetical protein